MPSRSLLDDWALAIAEQAGRSQALCELVAVVSSDAAYEVRERLVRLSGVLERGNEEKPLRVRQRCIATSRFDGGERQAPELAENRARSA